MMASLTDKTALVTGASRGIGRATAEALASAGAHVIVHYGRSAAEADALVAGIRAVGGSADAAQADLSMPDGAAALAKQVRAVVGQRRKSSWPMPASQKPPRSRNTRSKTSTTCSPRMSAAPSFS